MQCHRCDVVEAIGDRVLAPARIQALEYLTALDVDHIQHRTARTRIDAVTEQCNKSRRAVRISASDRHHHRLAEREAHVRFGLAGNLPQHVAAVERRWIADIQRKHRAVTDCRGGRAARGTATAGGPYQYRMPRLAVVDVGCRQSAVNVVAMAIGRVGQFGHVLQRRGGNVGELFSAGRGSGAGIESVQHAVVGPDIDH